MAQAWHLEMAVQTGRPSANPSTGPFPSACMLLGASSATSPPTIQRERHETPPRKRRLMGTPQRQPQLPPQWGPVISPGLLQQKPKGTPIQDCPGENVARHPQLSQPKWQGRTWALRRLLFQGIFRKTELGPGRGQAVAGVWQ